LAALPLTTGKQFARRVEACTMAMPVPAFESHRETEVIFAEMVDYFSDYRDCADLYSEVHKFEIYDGFQAYIDDLKKYGFSYGNLEAFRINEATSRSGLMAPRDLCGITLLYKKQGDICKLS
jgi:hypothetical protein